MSEQPFPLSPLNATMVEQPGRPGSAAWDSVQRLSTFADDRRFSAERLSEVPHGPDSAARCSQRGCIFPAAPGLTGRCAVHALEQREPEFFQSVQPSMLLLDYAKFVVADSSSPDSRGRDRRRLAALRAANQEEAA